MKARILGVLSVGMLAAPMWALAVPINQVSYASLTGTEVVTFDDVPGGGAEFIVDHPENRQELFRECCTRGGPDAISTSA